MSPPLQAKLLQVLQDGEFSRLGGKHDVHVDVRVITATNRDLETAVADGSFREDLYFRLNVVTIAVPPLRERREEVPFLVDYFIKKYSVQYNKPAIPVSAELAKQFLEFDWPGNVRQLENMIKRMVVLGGEAPILTELRQPPMSYPMRTAASASAASPPAPSVPPPVFTSGHAEPVVAVPVSPVTVTATAAGNVSLKDIARAAAREAERDLILRMLTRTRWNRKEAAEILGVSYKALLYKIKENGLDKAS
jgi:two-component system response regulator AtoC